MVTNVGWGRQFRLTSMAVMVGLHLTALLLGSVRAEASPPAPAAKLLARWNEIGRKLIAIAEDLPDDRYAYKPHPEARSFVDQLLHWASLTFALPAR